MKRIVFPLLAMASVAFLGLAGKLAIEHVRIITDVQATLVPLVADLPTLERRSSLLAEQVELSELQAALRVGSHEERVRVYVLPEQFDIDRLVALFDVFSLAIPRSGDIASMSPVEFGTPQREGDVEFMPIRVTFAANEDGARELMRFFRFAGVLTVADTLSHAETTALLQSIESENPAGIVPMEQFLSSDLLAYAQDHKPLEERLRRSFPEGEGSEIVQQLLASPVLRDARGFLGGPAGALIAQQKLWPMPMITVEELRSVPGRAPGWQTLSFVLHTYRRLGAAESA